MQSSGFKLLTHAYMTLCYVMQSDIFPIRKVSHIKHIEFMADASNLTKPPHSASATNEDRMHELAPDELLSASSCVDFN